MKRYPTDLSHFIIQCGDIGRLQCLTVLPVIAGDSMSIDYGAVFRLSSLRRNLTLDAQIDLFAFYIPHRQIYGTEFTDFVKQGIDETVTFTAGPAITNQFYLGSKFNDSTTFPLWISAGYNRIFNRYFVAPTDTGSQIADGSLVTGGQGPNFGALCGRLKVPWSTGIEGEPAAADREVASATVMDLIDFAKIQARYKTETERSYFASRYKDVLGQIWGGNADTDADERPTLLMHTTTTLSGYDIDGTSDAALGTFSGKSAAIAKLRMPSRYFPEHGAVRILALVRFPTINALERHKMANEPNMSYIDFSGDPDIVAAQGPEAIDSDDYFQTGTGADFGFAPFGQWYRYHPPMVHNKFTVLTGFPFIWPAPTNAVTARYIQNGEYNDVFATLQLGQWNAAGHANISCKRVVPPASTSLFAGTN